MVNLPSDSSLSVTWTREKSGNLRPDQMVLQEHFNGTYSASSAVPVSTQDWLSGYRFTCTVQHEELPLPLSKSVYRNTGREIHKGGGKWAKSGENRDKSGTNGDKSGENGAKSGENGPKSGEI